VASADATFSIDEDADPEAAPLTSSYW